MVTLACSDGSLVCRLEDLRHSVTLTDMFDMVAPGDAVVCLQHISCGTMARVLGFCQSREPGAEAPEADDRLMLDVHDSEAPGDHQELFKLIRAASFLNIEALLELGCREVALMLQGKTTAEMRETFCIENDFTPEEEEALKQAHAWAFLSDVI